MFSESNAWHILSTQILVTICVVVLVTSYVISSLSNSP